MTFYFGSGSQSVLRNRKDPSTPLAREDMTVVGRTLREDMTGLFRRSPAGGWYPPLRVCVRRRSADGCAVRQSLPCARGGGSPQGETEGLAGRGGVFSTRTTCLSAPTPQSAPPTAPLAQGSYSEGACSNRRAENAMAQSGGRMGSAPTGACPAVRGGAGQAAGYVTPSMVTEASSDGSMSAARVQV